MRIAIVTPHVFMHEEILPKVIFSPGRLALQLADGLSAAGHEVTLLSPGPVPTMGRNITADLSYFERELAGRGDTYIDLLKKHPLTFITLARQVQAELIARAYQMLDAGEFDLVHVYTNEEDIALPFAALVKGPLVFTHHDPFNFLVKYQSVFPKYPHLNWISMSRAQRRGMPKNTNWVGNVYHGVDGKVLRPVERPAGDYLLYLGRIIEPKGVHLAIAAARQAGMKLKIAGKHYAGTKDRYWTEQIAPELHDGVEYVGFVADDLAKRDLLAGARALLVPSVFEEPFGMVMIEALACGTPVVGFDSGAIPEVVREGVSGYVVPKAAGVEGLTEALGRLDTLSRSECRREFEERFTLDRMVAEHAVVYEDVLKARLRQS